MKRIFFLLFVQCLHLFVIAQQKEHKTPFEGYIDYKTEFKSLVPGISDNEIRDRVGEFIRIYFKNGDMKWVFTDNAGYVRSYQIIDAAKKISYDWSDTNPDTLFTFDLRSNKRNVIDSMQESGTDTVLGCICRVAHFKGLARFEDPEFVINSNLSYSFCPDLPVNPDHYRGYKEMNWEYVTERYRSIAIRMVSQFENWMEGVFTATKIVPEKVDPGIFTIDKSRIIKVMFAD